MLTQCAVLRLSRAEWRKSVRSNNGGNCVEVADLARAVGERDSKNPDGGNLIIARNPWKAFTATAERGDYDL
jgi:hypothetical protein